MIKRVSVIIPVFNKTRFLEHALSSVAAACAHDDEIIVVDDGSSAQAAKRISCICAGRARIERIEHGGVSAALNAGIRSAEGHYVSAFSSDDVMHPDHLTASICTLEHSKADFSFCVPEVIDREGGDNSRHFSAYSAGPTDYLDNRETAVTLIKNNFLCAPSMVTRKLTLAELGEFNESLMQRQDHEFWLRATLRGYSFFNSPCATISYRFGDDVENLSTQDRPRSAFELSYFVREAILNLSEAQLKDLLGATLTGYVDLPLDLLRACILLEHDMKRVRSAGFDILFSYLASQNGRALVEEKLGVNDSILKEWLSLDSQRL